MFLHDASTDQRCGGGSALHSVTADATTPDPTAAEPTVVDLTDDEVNELAHRVTENGLGPNESGIARFVQMARRSGAPTAACDALADRRLAEVMRLRAFGHIQMLGASR